MGRNLKKCQCFACKNKNNLDRLYGYYEGEYTELNRIINDLENIMDKKGKIKDNLIEELYTLLSYQRAECSCILDEIKDKIKRKETKWIKSLMRLFQRSKNRQIQ